MEHLSTKHYNPFSTPFDHTAESLKREDWEDWEDDSPFSPTESLGLESQKQIETSPRSKTRSRRTEGSQGTRYSLPKPSRLKSRARQKAQNAKAGIKLITDVSNVRKQQHQQQHVAHQMRIVSPDARTGKFVDAAALRALEGTPTEASVGTWHWLRRKPTHARSTKSPKGRSVQDLSPADRPIVIGISLPENDLNERTISPQTATLETPLDLGRHALGSKGIKPLTTQDQYRSVWSPDTEEGSPLSAASRVASSIYSQQTGTRMVENAPPVPSLPYGYKATTHSTRVRSAELDDDDNATPITLFEEDGSPVSTRKTSTKKGHGRSPATIGALSGWWDHIRTPFVEQQPNNPFTATSPAQNTTSSPSKQQDDWWNGVDEKKASAPTKKTALAIAVPTLPAIPPTIRRMSTLASSSAASSSVAASSSPPPTTSQERQQQTHADKARILTEENLNPSDEPPPYEASANSQAIRYRAVFPPGHRLREQFPPSPGPVSPGLAHTMTSQGAISMTEVPLTPQRSMLTPGETPLPDRPLGTFAPRDQVAMALGNSPAARAERRRQRHEKEDALARRIEGFWKGRGCIPENGCYGRRGREGRKRRRIYLAICGVVLALLILLIVLLATLLPKHAPAGDPYTFWLNLTDFPPIPTGVTTVVGPDNSQAVTGCVHPPTLWSCSLPKEQQDANKPFAPEQPKFIMQIQFDNNTRQLWNIPDGPTPSASSDSAATPAAPATSSSQPAAPKNLSSASSSAIANTPVERRTRAGGPIAVLDWLRRRGAAAAAAAAGTPVRRRAAHPVQLFDAGFTPSPSPPPFHEYNFRGNWTDGIVSPRKAGEPTPFFMSFLPSLDPVGPNVQPSSSSVPTGSNLTAAAAAATRRGLGNGITIGQDGNLSSILPPPALNADGTGAPAALRPLPVLQQPLRLFDRGLPTEHYGFYTYFDKTLYAASVNSSSSNGSAAADGDGGAAYDDASFVVTWGQTRFHVQIWTRTQAAGTARLLGGGGGGGGDNSTRVPGTFPYAITVSEDSHGGNFDGKGTYARRVDAQHRISLDNPLLVLNNIGFDSPLINHGDDPGLGGFDGGTGGCKCAWTNWTPVTQAGS